MVVSGPTNISIKFEFVSGMGARSSLVKIMDYRLIGTKPLYQPMLIAHKEINFVNNIVKSNRCQTNTYTNIDIFLIGHSRRNIRKFRSLCQYFQSWTCYWKYRLWCVGPGVWVISEGIVSHCVIIGSRVIWSVSCKWIEYILIYNGTSILIYMPKFEIKSHNQLGYHTVRASF